MCERFEGNVESVFCVWRGRRSSLIGCVVAVIVCAMAGLACGEVVSEILSEDGCGRATGYAEFNKIISFGGKTHVSWLDSKDGGFVVKVRTLDRETGQWSPTYSVGEAYDNHGGPSLVRDSEGYLHIVYYPHHHPFRYRRSVRPNDASQWGSEEQFGKRCTYSSMVCMPDDRLVLACRESSSKQWALNLYEKRSGGKWEGPRTILHGNAESGYTRWQASLAVGPDGETIHMSFQLYEQKLGDVGYAVGYLRSPDGGETWEKSDGTAVELPAQPATIDIVDGSAKAGGLPNFRVGNVAVDEKGMPWIIYARLDRQPYNTWVAHPTGDGGWERRSLLEALWDAGSGQSVKTPGNVVFDRDGVMYAAVTTVLGTVDAKEAMWGHPSAETVLLVSRDKGRTFDVCEISRADKTTPSWLCNIERPMRRELGEVTSLIYTRGHRGKTNKDILSNDVVWCDMQAIAAGEEL